MNAPEKGLVWSALEGGVKEHERSCRDHEGNCCLAFSVAFTFLRPHLFLPMYYWRAIF